MMSVLLRDSRHALRMLLRSPGFTALAILTFALGIGVNSAVFSVFNGVLLRQLPYPDSDRITMVWMDNSHLTGLYSARLADPFRAAFVRATS